MVVVDLDYSVSSLPNFLFLFFGFEESLTIKIIFKALKFALQRHGATLELDYNHCCHFGPNFLFESEFGLFAVKGSENSPNFVKKSEFFKDLNLTIHE